jgi:hypothetical protein
LAALLRSRDAKVFCTYSYLGLDSVIFLASEAALSALAALACKNPPIAAALAKVAPDRESKRGCAYLVDSNSQSIFISAVFLVNRVLFV